ncbi:MAG: hypothetical protein R3F60_00465 [bacterium]
MPAFLPPILFAVGIMVAITGGAKVPSTPKGWPDSWPIFAVGFAVALIGVVLWRIERAAHRKAAASEEGGENDPFRLLQGLLAPAQAFAGEIDQLDGKAICAGVDELLDTWIHPLGEARQRVVDRLGMNDGAEVLVTLAYGERILNRVWSAAADGHLTEARSVLPDALHAFQDAARMAQRPA